MSATLSYLLDLDGIQTRVLESGEGDRVVLFLHGAGARADRWTPTINRCAKRGFRCIAIDFPGHGFATKGAAPDYSVPAFARLVEEIVAELQLVRPAVVGTSLGGHVAASYTVANARKVAGLALVGSIGLAPLTPEQAALIATALVATEREQIEYKLRAVLADQSMVTPALIQEEWRINNSAGAAEGFAKLAAYFRDSHRDDLIGTRLAEMPDRPPLLLIWGERDRTTPLEMGERAAALLTEGRLSVVPAGGHAPYLDGPAEFDAALLPFLERLPWS